MSSKNSLFASLTLIATLSLTNIANNSSNQATQIDNHIISDYNVEENNLNNLDMDMIKK